MFNNLQQLTGLWVQRMGASAGEFLGNSCSYSLGYTLLRGAANLGFIPLQHFGSPKPMGPLLIEASGYHLHARWRHEMKALILDGYVFLGLQKLVFGDGIVLPFGNDAYDAAFGRYLEQNLR